MPNLPEPLGKLIDDFEPSAKGNFLTNLLRAKTNDEMTTRLQVIDALREAGTAEKDTVEPSWMQLATLLEEVNFLHAWRAVHVAAIKLGLPPDEIIDATMPQVQRHPYAKFLDSYRSKPAVARKAIQELLPTIEVALLTRGEESLVQRLQQANPEWFKAHFPFGLYSHDSVASDLVAIMSTASEPRDRPSGCADVSPYMPYGIVMGLSYNLDDLRQQKAELEKKYAFSAPVLTMVGQCYQNDQQLGDAIRCFEASVKLDPSLPVYNALANIYLNQGDEKQWLSTLEDYLNTDQVRVRSGSSPGKDC